MKNFINLKTNIKKKDRNKELQDNIIKKYVDTFNERRKKEEKEKRRKISTFEKKVEKFLEIKEDYREQKIEDISKKIKKDLFAEKSKRYFLDLTFKRIHELKLSNMIDEYTMKLKEHLYGEKNSLDVLFYNIYNNKLHVLYFKYKNANNKQNIENIYCLDISDIIGAFIDCNDSMIVLKRKNDLILKINTDESMPEELIKSLLKAINENILNNGINNFSL